jgi:predicted O-methyltransferase YrrM
MSKALKQKWLETLGVSDPWDADYKHLAFCPQGWFIKQAQKTMDSLCRHVERRIAIEVGAWIGKSTRFLAERFDLVIAVDHWLGSAEHREKYAHLLPVLFDQFLSNCVKFRDKILPLRMTSEEAAQLPLPKVGLIYIDGCHEEAEVRADIERYYGFLAEGGVMCGDDFQSNCERGQGIARAVYGFARERGLTICVREPLWWYQPEKDSR